MHFFFSEYNLY